MSIGPADAAALAGRRDGNRAPLLDLQGRSGNASPFVHWHLHEVIGRALRVVGYRRRRAMGATRRRVYRRRMLKPGLVSARRAPFPSRAPSASRLVFAFQARRVFRRPRAGQRDFPCAAAWRLRIGCSLRRRRRRVRIDRSLGRRRRRARIDRGLGRVRRAGFNALAAFARAFRRALIRAFKGRRSTGVRCRLNHGRWLCRARSRGVRRRLNHRCRLHRIGRALPVPAIERFS